MNKMLVNSSKKWSVRTKSFELYDKLFNPLFMINIAKWKNQYNLIRLISRTFDENILTKTEMVVIGRKRIPAM